MRPSDVLLGVTEEDRAAQRREMIGDGSGANVRACDLVAEIQQHFPDSPHADAADSHKVNVFDSSEHSFFQFLRCFLIAASIKFAMRCSASGTARRRALVASSCSCSGTVMSRRISSAMRLPLKS